MTPTSMRRNWILRGIAWGVIMFLAMAIFIPIINGQALQVASVLKALALWLVMGLAYGYTTHLIDRPKK